METVADRVGAWVQGWVVSRRTPPAEPVPGGWLVVTGTEREAERRVLTSVDHIADAAAAAARRPSWIKYAWPLDDGEPTAPGSAWTLTDVDRLMVADGDAVGLAPDLPPGYRLERWWDDGCAVVEIRRGEELAARGRCGVAGDVAVPDQIVTEPDHRRRGLGRIVMRRLADAAAEAGASRQVLVASVEGEALYTALGWRTVALMPAFVLA